MNPMPPMSGGYPQMYPQQQPQMIYGTPIGFGWTTDLFDNNYSTHHRQNYAVPRGGNRQRGSRIRQGVRNLFKRGSQPVSFI
ncbi:unnamed protein product [Didymodactylos carnosus]|uniref:Uncharacterized protein n=1 Tax=Didymodactylos carnosus TaxID=1234261 RepID=A0A815EAU0_9BILA|nr:unnamed protein product [Didymodactylos carnosus]CAF4134380.1 unnamed protein product [Didymodactylos carnosus]